MVIETATERKMKKFWFWFYSLLFILLQLILSWPQGGNQMLKKMSTFKGVHVKKLEDGQSSSNPIVIEESTSSNISDSDGASDQSDTSDSSIFRHPLIHFEASESKGKLNTNILLDKIIKRKSTNKQAKI